MDNKVYIGKSEFITVIAVTEEEHLEGLMYKAWPPPVMAFPYKDSATRKFWMKNTISPLDIVFCNNNKVIAIHKGEPMSTALIGPNSPSNLVIELPFGTAEKHGIHIGDTVDIKYSVDTVVKICEQRLNK